MILSTKIDTSRGLPERVVSFQNFYTEHMSSSLKLACNILLYNISQTVKSSYHI
ncbi:hypothetical protein THIOSC15_3550003 [uncultured Thiomicrorhabdus sp.]